jgi:DNA-binding GntR family transcriptional regulator
MRAHARAGDMRAMLQTEIRFHEHICTVADNAVLLKAWRALGPLAWTLLSGATHQTHYTPLELAERHVVLVAALRSRDPGRAAEVAQAHTAEMAGILSEALPAAVDAA